MCHNPNEIMVDIIHTLKHILSNNRLQSSEKNGMCLITSKLIQDKLESFDTPYIRYKKMKIKIGRSLSQE